MEYKLKSPCANCPFRKNQIGPHPIVLGKGRAEGLVRDVLIHGGSFACHKTTSFDGEYDDEDSTGYQYTDKESQCAGAGIMQIKSNRTSSWMQISERMGWDIGVKNLDLDSPVFDSAEDFMEFHTYDE